MADIDGCTCKRNLPYFDWSHETTCALYVAPTASPKASEGADPSESEFLCSLLPKLDFIERLVLKQDHARGRFPLAGKVREISTAIIQRVENTRVAPAPDPHSCDEVLIAKYLQDPEWAARFRAEVARLDAPDPRVEEIRKMVDNMNNVPLQQHQAWALSVEALPALRYLLSKLDGR